MSLNTRIKVIQKKVLDNYGKIKRLYELTDHEGLINIRYTGTILKNKRIISEEIPDVKGLTVNEFMKEWCRDQEAGPEIEINFKGLSVEILREIVKSKRS